MVSPGWPKDECSATILRVTFHCAWSNRRTLAEGREAISGSDLLLTCSDCGQEFVFTAGERRDSRNAGTPLPGAANRVAKPNRGSRMGHAPSHSQHEGGGKAAQRRRSRHEHGDNGSLRQLWANHDGSPQTRGQAGLLQELLPA